ncbi:CD3e molecule, epsilon associated protein [Clupea harengus]|uniref:CD3e molecule, epsilon associated protein n=1 Tax=Clupea harengus TaxID=7950 RepID=A0A6P3WAV9_CLUHA|nr:CD3e molecule, epsilon associated protein [Clupea harengus]
MPQDMSAGSSDKEVIAKKTKRTTGYECPDDFTSVTYTPCRSARGSDVFGEDKELWLIKAPANFDPRSFSGMKLPLAGLETLQTGKAGAARRIFSTLGRRSTTTGLRLLTNDPDQPTAHRCAPAFSGALNVSESYGDCRANQGPIAVPAAPAPQLPDGLRQRYFPFGSGIPASAPRVVAEEASVPVGLVKTELVVEEETPRKKAKKVKKEKKEKRIKQEQQEEEEEEEEEAAAAAAVVVKMEQLNQSIAEQSLPDGEATEGRKKKKKKKDKEREKVKSLEGVDPYVRIKEEPMDRDFVKTEHVLKKKKKKKIKTDDD